MDFGSIAESIIGPALSIGSGGIFGLVGSLTGAFVKAKVEKSRRVWQTLKWEHEEKLFDKTVALKAQETEDELRINSQELEGQLQSEALSGSYKGLTASIAADGVIGETHMIINDIKALFRPLLTIILWGIATYVFNKIMIGDIGDFSAAEKKDLILYMVQTIFFCASTAAVWWFGDRALAPPKIDRPKSLPPVKINGQEALI